MSESIITALIALFGTMIGTFCGIVTSSKLTNYRLAQLEKKVDKHNNFAHRIPLVEERIASVSRRISDLENAQLQK